jgi:hypothetical protein
MRQGGMTCAKHDWLIVSAGWPAANPGNFLPAYQLLALSVAVEAAGMQSAGEIPVALQMGSYNEAQVCLA